MHYAYIMPKLLAVAPIESLNSDGFLTFSEDATPDQKAAAQALSDKFIAHDDAILAQIDVLEDSITDRRMREAILGTDSGWLTTTNQQIAALRATLTT